MLIIGGAWLSVAAFNSYMLLAQLADGSVPPLVPAMELCDHFFWALEVLVLVSPWLLYLGVLAVLPFIIGAGLLFLNARAAFAAKLFAIIWALLLIVPVASGLENQWQAGMAGAAFIFNAWTVWYLSRNKVKQQLLSEIQPLDLRL
jgi:hypothetical protein